MPIPQGLDDAYEKAIEAERQHLKIAGAMIKAALSLITVKGLNVDDLAKATASLDKGTRMETRSNEQIIRLIRNRPATKK